MGFAQNLMRLADERARATGARLQALTTGMPQFYRPLGWGVCGRQTFAQTLSRNLPQVSDGADRGTGGFWHVRPWRQVELGDLMALYDMQYAAGHRHGRAVRGILAVDDRPPVRPRHLGRLPGRAGRGLRVHQGPQDPRDRLRPGVSAGARALLGRVRAEALERAYPEVTVHAPADHPVIEAFRGASGRIIDQESYERPVSMYHIPDLGRFLKCILPELSRRARPSGLCAAPGAGHYHGRPPLADPCRGQEHSRVEPDKLSRRHLTLSPPTLVRLADGPHQRRCRGQRGRLRRLDRTALDAARILFPVQPIWRSPLDAATA